MRSSFSKKLAIFVSSLFIVSPLYFFLRDVDVAGPTTLPRTTDPETTRLLKALNGRVELVPIATVPLSSANVETFHPQGLKIIGHELFLTTVEGRGHGFGHLLHFTLDGDVPTSARFGTRRTFDPGPEGKMNHAGGIDVDGDLLVIPLAEYRREGPGKILRVKVDDVDSSETFADVPDHVGTAIVTDSKIWALNWSSELAFGFDRKTKVGPVILKGTGWGYQDCKRVGPTTALCAAVKIGLGLDGELQLVEFDEIAGAIQVLWRLQVPRVDGEVLTRNPFDYAMTGGDEPNLVLYFAPHDHPDTKLYVYRAVIK